jgi:hypothetical protein
MAVALVGFSMSAAAQSTTGTTPADQNDPGVPASQAAAKPAETKVDAAATPIVLTEEEKAERESRKACKVAICAAFHNRKPGSDIACTVLKSYRKEQLDKLVGRAKVSWPWGSVRCSSNVKLKRETLITALTAEKVDLTLEPHDVTCTVERDKEAPSEIKLVLAPKVTFEKGKATAAQVNWGKLEAPTLVKTVMWPATATDNKLNVLGSTLVEDINDFIGDKCMEVKSEWEGR